MLISSRTNCLTRYSASGMPASSAFWRMYSTNSAACLRCSSEPYTESQGPSPTWGYSRSRRGCLLASWRRSVCSP